MQEHQEAMVKSLVAVAWADGRLDETESEVIDALAEAFELSAEDTASIREFAKEKRSLDEIPLTELSASDRRMLLQHATLLTHVDGEKSSEEVELLNELVEKLKIPKDEAKVLMEATDLRAKRIFAR